MTSASRIASRAWSWTRASIGIVRIEFEPAGVDHDEAAAVPFRVAVEAVAGGSRAVLDDRGPPADDAVEERALADVGPPHDRDDGDPGPGAGHRQAAPDEIGATGEGSDVVRPAGVAARSRAASARSWALALVSGVPGEGQDPLGHVAQVLDRRGCPAGDTDDLGIREDRGIVEVADALDLDGRRPGDLAQAGQFLRVGARAAADDDHEVHVTGEFHGVFLPSDRDRTDRVDDLELVGAPDHERRQALEFPGRLGGLADQRHPLASRDGRLPLLFLVDHDGIGREAEQADDLGMLGRAEQDDRVALFHESTQFALLLDDPRAGPIDDLESARVRPLQDVRTDPVRADDDRGAVVHVVELLDGLDAEDLQLAHDALVVDDLSEGMGGLAGGRGLLGLVDRFADAVAEPRPLGDADFLDRIHASIIARGLRRARLRVDAALVRRQEFGDPVHEDRRRDRLHRPLVRVRRDEVAERERLPDPCAVTRPPGCGNRWPFGQTSVGARDADRDDRCSAAQREQGDPITSLLEGCRSGLRVPSGKTNRAPPSARIRLASRYASMSAFERSTGCTPPLAASQPMTGQSNSSFLPSQWIRRPIAGISHDPTIGTSRFEA